MKILKNRKLAIAVSLSILMSLLLIVTAYAASKNYYGLTTIYYNNYIADQGGWNWNGSFSDYTSPSRSMDQFGLNFWSTYCSCNNSIQWDSYIGYSIENNPWMMQYNKSSISDGMAQVKVDCEGQTLRGHNYIQHWWQDSGYSGDGGTIDYKKVLSDP